MCSQDRIPALREAGSLSAHALEEEPLAFMAASFVDEGDMEKSLPVVVHVQLVDYLNEKLWRQAGARRAAYVEDV